MFASWQSSSREVDYLAQIGSRGHSGASNLACQTIRQVDQIGRNKIPVLLGAQIGGLSRSMFRWTRDKRRAQT